MTNFDLSRKVFDFLHLASVETVVVCAGARNAPLVMALSQTKFEVIQFFEERSAAFYALGLMKSSGKPVAVLTTSGTAVAELLPAAIESTYQGLPLILVTADRPKTYRGTGAPQAIEQIRLFSDYVESVFDLDVNDKKFDFEWSFKKPVQLNVCFDEPLIDLASSQVMAELTLKKISDQAKNSSVQINQPFAIIGELNSNDVSLVKDFLLQSKIAFYAEALSQLAADPQLSTQCLQASDHLVKKAFKEKLFESVIRIGGAPTLRFWRDLESEFSHLPVFNYSDKPFSGLARDSRVLPLKELVQAKIEFSKANFATLKAKDLELQKQKRALLEKFPLSEPAVVQDFSKEVNDDSLYLGNSLPIRHWDSFSVNQSKVIYANRGANGIDGQVSTYLGWSENQKKSFCFIGDLTALYDLAALGLTPQLRKNVRRIVVLNNFGGQIFQRVLKNKLFINEHTIQFQNWAQMWSWNYILVRTKADFQKLSQDQALNSVIEIQPDPEQTRLFWDEWDQICQKI